MKTLPFIPLLIGVFLVSSVFAISSSRTSSNKSSAVLSESEDNRGASASPKVHETETPEVEPTETPEAEVEPPELENESEVKVQEGTEEGKVKLKLGKKENKFVFFEQKFGAESQFPVSVNKATNTLTITTPAGTKTVTVLPDAAVERMLAQNVIDRVSGTNGQTVQVKSGENGELEYEIPGTREGRFLGLFNVVIPKTVSVSAQTGSLLSINESLVSRILDLLSI